VADEIYKTVVHYLESRDGNWKFIYGSRVFSAHELIEEMRKNRKFRAMIVEEVVKTAVDMFQRSK
jgi:hypothetical protein